MGVAKDADADADVVGPPPQSKQQFGGVYSRGESPNDRPDHFPLSPTHSIRAHFPLGFVHIGKPARQMTC